MCEPEVYIPYTCYIFLKIKLAYYVIIDA